MGLFTLRGLLVASPKDKAASGRPTMYSDDLAKEIFKKISLGRSVHKICQEDGMPSRQTFYRWLGEYDDFSDNYRKALELRQDYHFDEMLEIADLVEEDNVKIQKAKLMIDTRKWVLSRMNPKKYGDKAGETETIDDNPTPVSVNIEVRDARKP